MTLDLKYATVSYCRLQLYRLRSRSHPKFATLPLRLPPRFLPRRLHLECRGQALPRHIFKNAINIRRI